VVGEGAARHVFVVKDGVAAKRTVETGAELGDLVAVRGLAAGERVVASPLDRSLDGRKVKVAQK